MHPPRLAAYACVDENRAAAPAAPDDRLMMIFWIAAALLAGGIAALIMLQAARASRADILTPADPAAALYERQLSELGELEARGVLSESDRKAAFAEAARRLLAVAPATAPSASRQTPRWAVPTAIGVCAIGALALYVTSGSPGLADQPFSARLASWRSALQTAPQSLSAAQMAAVLESLTRDRPDNAELHVFLGKAYLAASDPSEAVIALRRAVALSPGDPAIQALLGQALVASSEDETVSPEAEAAFRKAVAADPSDMSSRYFLAMAQVARGETEAGISAWRALRQQMSADDPRSAVLDKRIAEASIAGADPGAQAAMIAGMVSGLAERLRSEPDNPGGWARLVRSYGVLGNVQAQRQAISDARKAMAARPKSLARFEAALKAQGESASR